VSAASVFHRHVPAIEIVRAFGQSRVATNTCVVQELPSVMSGRSGMERMNMEGKGRPTPTLTRVQTKTQTPPIEPLLQ
jgi:hypothetical protein